MSAASGEVRHRDGQVSRGAGNGGNAGNGGSGGAGNGGTGGSDGAGNSGNGGSGAGGVGTGAGTGGGGLGTGGGMGGGGGVCTNACTSGTTQCLSGASLQTCGAGSDGCPALSTSACSTGLVCERTAPADCLDPTWAEWPMPNGPVDVAAGAPNPEAYTDNGDGTVTDNVTGLMWQQAVPVGPLAGGGFTQPQAVAFCPTLTLATHSDWRLPTIIELTSIVDLGQSSPSINVTFFPATQGNFWSSSPEFGSEAVNMWIVYFDNGGMAGTDYMGLPYHVRCVR